MKSVGITDLGCKRENNEDYIFFNDDNIGALPNLYIVADGMGGYNYGEVASSKAVGYFCEYVKSNFYDNENDILDFIIDGILFSNSKVYEDSNSDDMYNGMGTTITVCTIMNNKAYIAHVGDSRLYIVTGDKINQLTTDHSYVNEMVKAGEITEVEARMHPRRNIITRAVGIKDTVEVDALAVTVGEGDYLLICSDGLTDMVTDEDIYNIISEMSDINMKADKLVKLAIENGGHDNVSAILINIDCEVTK